MIEDSAKRNGKRLPEIDAFVGNLKEAGLCGIEAIYSNNRGYDEQNMCALAKKYDLLITGGSDFHGKNNKGVVIDIFFQKRRISLQYLFRKIWNFLIKYCIIYIT